MGGVLTTSEILCYTHSKMQGDCLVEVLQVKCATLYEGEYWKWFCIPMWHALGHVREKRGEEVDGNYCQFYIQHNIMNCW